MQNLNWNNIRPLNNSQNEGFEELVCQLARNEKIARAKSFIRKGTPDAGVECFWILDDDKEICYQAKFFTSPLSSTQWGEIDSSIKTVLDKHPKLIKYIISIPQDRADARVIGKKSFLDKWNESVEKWQGWAQEKNLSIEFIYEGNSELLDKLSKPENVGKMLFWFNKEEYSKEWFFKRNQRRINDLDERYSPEINIDLDMKYIFDGLYFNKSYQDPIHDNISKAYEQFTEAINILHKNHIDFYEKFSESFDLLKYTVNDLDFINSRKISLLKSAFQNTFTRIASYSSSFLNNIKNEDDNKRLKKQFNKLTDSLHDVFSGVQNFDSKLAEKPYLIIEGEAGVGKSHLIADILTEKFNENQYSLILLGQHFYQGDIWTQIKDQLEIRVSKEEFLGALNAKSESLGTRIVIYIDALNEGEGKYLWKSQLLGFVKDIEMFPNVGLVFTIRSTYQDIIFPDRLWHEINKLEHRGFDNSTIIATKVFFEYYSIQEPPIPLLNPEFRNPLFLKLFCLGLRNNGIKTIPQDYDNLNTIFNYLLEAVNRSLSRKFDFEWKDFDLVNEAIAALVSQMVQAPSYQISRKEARNLLTDKFRHDVSDSRNILSELFNENILTENAVYNPDSGKYDKEIVYFSYERLGDYLIAQSLLYEDKDKFIKNNFKISDLKIYPFIQNENALIEHRSMVEILSILLPEKNGIELYELVEENNNYEIGDAFIKSLIWRNSTTISEKIDKYLNSYIFKIHGLHRGFQDVLIQLALRKDHYLNAYFLHEYLFPMKVNQRDYLWTVQINDSNTSRILSDWVFESNVILDIDEETKKLLIILLSWFLTSSNRELRDITTKGLVKVFQNDLTVLQRMLSFSEDVNDLYVQERLYAAAYGATLRTTDSNQIKHFAGFIYRHVFKDKNPIEHHLLRDYARGIIEYANHKQLIEDIDMVIVRPPYKSEFPTKVPVQKEIEKYKVDKKGEVQNSLYELVMGFSDFARYTLGTNYHSKISSISIDSHNIYKNVYGLSKDNKKDIEDLVTFCKNYKSEHVKQEWKDHNKNYYDNLPGLIEERFKLSTKSSLLLHEYISKISADYFTKKARFDISILQRLIINDVFKTYGWTNKLFNHSDYRGLKDAYFNKNTYSAQESIGKKYALISYYKWLSIILDNYLIELNYPSSSDDKFDIYTGPWSTNRRDIDPSILERRFYAEEAYRNNKITYWYPENNIRWNEERYKEWVLDINDLIHPKDLIDVVDNKGTRWLNLYSYPSWYEDKKEDVVKKQVWYHVKSYIVKKSDKDEIVKSLKGKSFFNHQIPQEADINEVFSREYYWSEAYSDCTYENHPEYSDKRLHANIEDSHIMGFPTSMNYMWDKDRDFTLQESINIKRPTKCLYELLELHFKDNDYEFYNVEHKLSIFNPAIKFQEGNDCLLVDKNYLIKKLSEKNLDIIWLVLGAKEVIGNMSIIHEGDINNVFYLNESAEIEGNFEIKPYVQT